MMCPVTHQWEPGLKSCKKLTVLLESTWEFKVPCSQIVPLRWLKHCVWNTFEMSIPQQSQPVVLLISPAGREDSLPLCRGDGIGKTREFSTCRKSTVWAQAQEDADSWLCSCTPLPRTLPGQLCPPAHHVALWEQGLCSPPGFIALSHIHRAAACDRWCTQIKTEEEDNVSLPVHTAAGHLSFFPKFGPTALKQFRTATASSSHCLLQNQQPTNKPVLRSTDSPARSCSHFSFPFLVFWGFLFAAAQPFVFLSTHVLPHSTEKIHNIEFSPTNNCSCLFFVDLAIFSGGNPFDLLNFK